MGTTYAEKHMEPNVKGLLEHVVSLDYTSMFLHMIYDILKYKSEILMNLIILVTLELRNI